MELAWLTHVPLLTAAAEVTTGAVLELGAGLGSTLVLHGICAARGRRLVTLESDLIWLRTLEQLRRPWHELRHVESFADPELYRGYYGLVFMDHGREQERGYSLRQVTGAGIVIVHDTCHAELYGYEPTLSDFRYRFDFDRMLPQTTAVSNTFDVQALFGDLDL